MRLIVAFLPAQAQPAEAILVKLPVGGEKTTQCSRLVETRRGTVDVGLAHPDRAKASPGGAGVKIHLPAWPSAVRRIEAPQGYGHLTLEQVAKVGQAM